MKILMIASEVDGLVKTGGLADVAYALPKALMAMGHDVKIIMPAYQRLNEHWQDWPSQPLNVQLSYFEQHDVNVRLGAHRGLPLAMVEHSPSFGRDGIYDDGHHAYVDNPYRFSLLCKTALEWCKQSQWQPDVVHTHDWPSAMACFYLAEHYKADPFFAKTRSVLSIHNGAYQMKCPSHWGERIGINNRFFNATDFEDCGDLNILKGAMGFADGVTTVSPGYAKELMTMLGGHGLHEKYASLALPVQGILNGCDYDQWNPEVDTWLPAQFATPNDGGKQTNKLALQDEVGLPQSTDKPVLGIICRLVDQKGIHLFIPVAKELMKYHDCQVVILGSGDPLLAGQLDQLQANYSDRFRFINGYDVGLSHRIEAGCDAFIMPSIFEPCGLNQIYSLRYGTLPLVRCVGGLKDTVVPVTDLADNADVATGFMFEDISVDALLWETVRMLALYKERPDVWRQLQDNAMAQRFDWESSGKQYEDCYQRLLQDPKTSHNLL